MTEDSRTTESLLARRELASKATPGPWKKGIALRQGYGVDAIWDCSGVLVADTEKSVSPCEESDAAHIAANSPDVVMADIDEILRLRAQVERLEKEADWLAENCWKKPEVEYIPIREMRGGFYCDECPHEYDCRKCWREAARNAVERSRGCRNENL